MKLFDELNHKLESLPLNLKPQERLERVLKIALSAYLPLKEHFFSEDFLKKEETLKTARWLLDKVEEEITIASQIEGVSGKELLTKLYASESLSAEECKQFMQARALVMEHASEIFAKKKTKRRSSSIKI